MPQVWIEQESRHWLQFMSTKEILLKNSNARTLMILIGRNKLDCIGDLNQRKILVSFPSQIGTKDTVMSFWDLKKDFVSLH